MTGPACAGEGTSSRRSYGKCRIPVVACWNESDRSALRARGGVAGGRTHARVRAGVPRALSDRRVRGLGYVDRPGVATGGEIEPLGYVGGTHWYLVGWCRLRGSIRCFRLDRIVRPVATDEQITPRP